MVKPISTGVSVQLAAAQRRPVNLITLDLGSGVTLRYATAKQNIVFPAAGNTYTAKNIEYSAPSFSAEGQLSKVTVKLDNTARDMASYAVQRDFKGKKIIIWRIFRDASGATDYDLIFNGWMQEPSFDYNWISIPADTGTALDRITPHRNYGRSCAWSFGKTECDTDGLSSGASLTRSSTTVRGGNPGNQNAGVTSFYDTTLKNSGASAWVYGKVFLLVGGASEERMVVDFEVTAGSGGTVVFDVPCSTAISAATKYELRMGCSKSWTACSGASTLGPTADNTANFSGFLHITDEPDPIRYK
jgi:hypothetical protein